MTERERLIKLLKLADDYAATNLITNYDDAIADNADFLLANGVTVPPCKVGDMVYKVVKDMRIKKPYECKVVGFWYSADERCSNVHVVRYVNGEFDCSFSLPFDDFGKTIFLTKEEAERELERRNGNETN